MSEGQDDRILEAAISGIVSCVQLQADAFEVAFGMHDWDSDDEESLVVLAGQSGLLQPKDELDSDDEVGSSRSEGCDRSFMVEAADPESTKRTNNLGYFEITVPLYTDAEFRHCFHVSRHTFEILVQKLVPLMVNAMLSKETPIRGGRPPIPLEKKILIVLWFFATQQPFRLISERFEVSKASVEDCFRRVITALVELAEEYVRWPSAGDIERIASGFRERTGLSDVLGVIGTARFSLRTSKAAPKSYSDATLGCCTVTSLFVCDHRMQFLDCFPGLPGSLSNVMVLRNSNLQARILANPEGVFPGNAYLVGGPFFPIEPWLITPFLDDGQLPPAKCAFNDAVAAVLDVRHRAVALLKGRFPRLKTLGIGRLDYLPMCVTAAFVLHNVCLTEDDDESNHVREYVDAGWEMAVAEYNAAVEKGAGDIDIGADPDRWLQGCEKRNTLSNKLNFVPI